jgi:hypothetical protein
MFLIQSFLWHRLYHLLFYNHFCRNTQKWKRGSAYYGVDIILERKVFYNFPFHANIPSRTRLKNLSSVVTGFTLIIEFIYHVWNLINNRFNYFY